MTQQTIGDDMKFNVGISQYMLEPIVKAIICGPRGPYSAHLGYINDPVGPYYRYLKGYLGIAFSPGAPEEFAFVESIEYHKSGGYNIVGVEADSPFLAVFPDTDSYLITCINGCSVGANPPSITVSLLTNAAVPGMNVTLTYRKLSEGYKYKYETQAQFGPMPTALDYPLTTVSTPGPPTAAVRAVLEHGRKFYVRSRNQRWIPTAASIKVRPRIKTLAEYNAENQDEEQDEKYPTMEPILSNPEPEKKTIDPEKLEEVGKMLMSEKMVIPEKGQIRLSSVTLGQPIKRDVDRQDSDESEDDKEFKMYDRTGKIMIAAHPEHPLFRHHFPYQLIENGRFLIQYA